MVFSGAGAVFIDTERGRSSLALRWSRSPSLRWWESSFMSNDNPTMNGHENYDERASNETKQKKTSKKSTNFQYDSWVLELGQWDAWLSLGCGTGEILVFFPLFFSLLCICWNSLCAVSFDGNVFSL